MRVDWDPMVSLGGVVGMTGVAGDVGDRTKAGLKSVFENAISDEDAMALTWLGYTMELGLANTAARQDLWLCHWQYPPKPARLHVVSTFRS